MLYLNQPPPVLKATGARFSLNMLSAVNALGHFRFMTVDGCVTATVFRDFLKRLISDVDRKIFLIVDGHPTHKAKLVSKFVTDNHKRIELFFLPPYSPNPKWGSCFLTFLFPSLFDSEQNNALSNNRQPPLTIPLFSYRLANSLIPHLPIPNYLFQKQNPKPRTPQISSAKVST